MSDKELLELAAKAESRDLSEYEWESCSYWMFAGDATHFWNPLRNDGDAFRLAVKLKLELNIEGIIETSKSFTNDSYYAARRAIVIAAAEIGKSIELES